VRYDTFVFTLWKKNSYFGGETQDSACPNFQSALTAAWIPVQLVMEVLLPGLKWPKHAAKYRLIFSLQINCKTLSTPTTTYPVNIFYVPASNLIVLGFQVNVVIFRRLREIVNGGYLFRYVCPSVTPSVRPHGKTRLPLNEFFIKCGVWGFLKNLSKSSFD
jgi:hypothetical protein